MQVGRIIIYCSIVLRSTYWGYYRMRFFQDRRSLKTIAHTLHWIFPIALDYFSVASLLCAETSTVLWRTAFTGGTIRGIRCALLAIKSRYHLDCCALVSHKYLIIKILIQRDRLKTFWYIALLGCNVFVLLAEK